MSLAAENARMSCSDGRLALLALVLCSSPSCGGRTGGRLAPDGSARTDLNGPVGGQAPALDAGAVERGPSHAEVLGVDSDAAEDVSPGWGSSVAPGCSGTRMAPRTSIIAHLPVSPSELVGATATVCRNGTCTTGSYRAPEGDRTWGSFLFADLDGAMVEDELDGYCTMGFSYPLTKGSYAEGDVYSVKVVDAKDRTLIDVSRPVRYDLEGVNLRCGRTGDPTANLELYPESPSGITCDNHYCIYPGVHLRASLPTPEAHATAVVTLCRNGTCHSGVPTIGSCPVGATCSTNESLSGAYLGTVVVEAKADGIVLDVASHDDSAVLADGDTYSLVVTQGANTLVSKSVTVTYSAEYLNGPECDPVPCRHAIVDLDSRP